MPTPKRPTEDDYDSDDENARAVKIRRVTKQRTDPTIVNLTINTLPREPILTEKEKQDILRYVETEATEVRPQ